jgi:hypothetical protein
MFKYTLFSILFAFGSVGLVLLLQLFSIELEFLIMMVVGFATFTYCDGIFTSHLINQEHDARLDKLTQELNSLKSNLGIEA